MKINTKLIVLVAMTALFACKHGNKDKNLSTPTIDSLQSNSDNGVYDNQREKLTLSVPDTIKVTKSFLFSNLNSKDLFILTVNPGLVKNSKSSLQIMTKDKKILYVQTFDTFYFIKWIFEPDTIPQDISQKEYDSYMENYRKSLTQKQYESFFKKNIHNFFNEIYFVGRERYNDLIEWEEDITEKDFLTEVLADSTIKIVDIACFDCEEGGTIIGYSKKQNKIVTLLEHD